MIRFFPNTRFSVPEYLFYGKKGRGKIIRYPTHDMKITKMTPVVLMFLLEEGRHKSQNISLELKNMKNGAGN